MKQVNNRQKMFVKPNQNWQKFVVAGKKTQKAVEMKKIEARVQKLRTRSKSS